MFSNVSSICILPWNFLWKSSDFSPVDLPSRYRIKYVDYFLKVWGRNLIASLRIYSFIYPRILFFKMYPIILAVSSQSVIGLLVNLQISICLIIATSLGIYFWSNSISGSNKNKTEYVFDKSFNTFVIFAPCLMMNGNESTHA